MRRVGPGLASPDRPQFSFSAQCACSAASLSLPRARHNHSTGILFPPTSPPCFTSFLPLDRAYSPLLRSAASLSPSSLPQSISLAPSLPPGGTQGGTQTEFAKQGRRPEKISLACHDATHVSQVAALLGLPTRPIVIPSLQLLLFSEERARRDERGRWQAAPISKSTLVGCPAAALSVGAREGRGRLVLVLTFVRSLIVRSSAASASVSSLRSIIRCTGNGSPVREFLLPVPISPSAAAATAPPSLPRFCTPPHLYQ